MAWTKAKTAIIAGVVVLLAAGTTTITVKKIEQYKADDLWRVQNISTKILDQVSPQVKILPSKFSSGGTATKNNKMMGTGSDVTNIVRMAYEFRSPVRIIFSTELPKRKYDFMANLPSGNAEALQREIRKQFGVIAKRETQETDVLLLAIKSPNAQGLKPSETQVGSSQSTRPNEISCENESISHVAETLEEILRVPVVDKTGLTENFDIDLKWERNDPRHDSLKQALLDQLGLELVPDRQPVEMLMVEKVK
jgi:uncharacterized protein (TIGR03435 family)